MIKLNGKEVKMWDFPGGELGVNILDNVSETDTQFTFEMFFESSDDIMTLLLAKDALERDMELKTSSVELWAYQLPYAQQDRVCEKGEALSVRVFANLINSMKFDKVTIMDCHSDVGLALIDNCVHFPVWELFRIHNAFGNLRHHIKRGMVLVSPDAGALKKVNKVAKALEGADVVKADKVRNTKTGEITDTMVYADPRMCIDKDFLIVDDICVGGATFLPIAQRLKELGARSVSLYVTHGIFSRGVQHLVDNGIDWVYTTDTRIHAGIVKQHKKVTVIEL